MSGSAAGNVVICLAYFSVFGVGVNCLGVVPFSFFGGEVPSGICFVVNGNAFLRCFLHARFVATVSGDGFINGSNWRGDFLGN